MNASHGLLARHSHVRNRRDGDQDRDRQQLDALLIDSVSAFGARTEPRDHAA